MPMISDNDLNKFSNGDVYFWIEQESSIHLKAVTSDGDPVELTAIEAREFATALLEAALKLETL
jgi:hypothetical protein